MRVLNFAFGRRRGLLFIAAFAIACDSKAPPPPPTPTVKKKKDDDKKAQDAAKPAAPEDYAYSPVGKRDPFRPFFVDQDDADAEKAKRELTELQHFETDQLRLVAIIGSTSQPLAMFEDPTGKGHIVTTGTPIGRNGGRVNKIKKDEVVILEELPDALGKKKTSPMTIKLPGDELVLDGK
jgi:type IV pilus assembly protein PilP